MCQPAARCGQSGRLDRGVGHKCMLRGVGSEQNNSKPTDSSDFKRQGK